MFQALFYKKYSPASDVWSYGMLMFEIWSLGEKPFPSKTVQEVHKCMNVCMSGCMCVCTYSEKQKLSRPDFTLFNILEYCKLSKKDT